MPPTIWCTTVWTCTENSREVFFLQAEHITHQWVNQGSPDIFLQLLLPSPCVLHSSYTTGHLQPISVNLLILFYPRDPNLWSPSQLFPSLCFKTLFLVDNDCLQEWKKTSGSNPAPPWVLGCSGRVVPFLPFVLTEHWWLMWEWSVGSSAAWLCCVFGLFAKKKEEIRRHC